MRAALHDLVFPQLSLETIRSMDRLVLCDASLFPPINQACLVHKYWLWCNDTVRVRVLYLRKKHICTYKYIHNTVAMALMAFWSLEFGSVCEM